MVVFDCKYTIYSCNGNYRQWRAVDLQLNASIACVTTYRMVLMRVECNGLFLNRNYRLYRRYHLLNNTVHTQKRDYSAFSILGGDLWVASITMQAIITELAAKGDLIPQQHKPTGTTTIIAG
jgi:hypothetical protein